MKLFAILISILVASNAFASATALTVGSVSETSINMAPQNCDAGNGNSFSNNSENVFLFAQNVHGSASAVLNVAVQTASHNIPGYGPVTKSAIAQTLVAGQSILLGPFPAQAYNDANSLVQITCSGTAPSSILLKAFASSKMLKIP